MQIVTSWMRQGIEQGIQREKDLVVRQIKRKLGEINADLEAQVRGLDVENLEILGEALWDFATVENLRDWLDNL
ncbi:DUF4351 domain-containing protein [Trichormus sp. NMC-1]|uniref:DUF4351 domain-containing protein n=1 Tax=Trichormus sp. NMC-1 TaxID=1853259 RepID=UPI0008DC1FA9|nr:DUF4351 domain-containing protein [Trichormus sp. NMC-1]